MEFEFENKNYPEFFPQDCPPKGAVQEEIRAYRFVKDKLLVVDDFKCHVELKLKYTTSNKYPYAEYGISVNTNIEEMYSYLKMSPVMRKKFKYIAVGKTYICTGKIKPTPGKIQPSHHSWYLYKESVPHKYFKLVE
ncbi:hypothetical protein LGL08_00190 [Clostridium estertheticum]|uniref:hypothetical protein n=1 Tax=Clostridium estertheticum TaxID=238834 RepID=UPI001CF4DB0E|nr:hypothetical protein [Clostridium estertheticum]MCB2305633.1 hypothetical protein [Clostridium estertheticum]MCB2344551.1 hypothetical protein [Clostridium estertheticum]MCB2347989.1 hypothetical protein [Clostridium estertheticum]WAG45633.1 hypothetical protein LL127_19270 [Clostridium estertheticum]